MHTHRARPVLYTFVVAGVLSLSAMSAAQTPADNTKSNERDTAKGAVTADQQKDNASDRALTQKIRQSIMRDKSLSTYAHNVKVIAAEGQVTLKGPVRTEDEKRLLEGMATDVAGAGHVTNELSIAPIKTTKR